MRLCGQISVITAFNVWFIVVKSSQTINLPADDTTKRLHPFYEIGKLISEIFDGVLTRD